MREQFQIPQTSCGFWVQLSISNSQQNILSLCKSRALIITPINRLFWEEHCYCNLCGELVQLMKRQKRWMQEKDSIQLFRALGMNSGWNSAMGPFPLLESLSLLFFRQLTCPSASCYHVANSVFTLAFQGHSDLYEIITFYKEQIFVRWVKPGGLLRKLIKTFSFGLQTMLTCQAKLYLSLKHYPMNVLCSTTAGLCVSDKAHLVTIKGNYCTYNVKGLKHVGGGSVLL